MTTLPQTAPMRLTRPVSPSQMMMPGPMMPGHPAMVQGQPGTQGLTGGDVWRVLRANLWLIVIMVMAAAIVGYVVNQYLAQHYSRYTATALMEVKTVGELPVPGAPPGAASPAEIELVQNSQARKLMHETLFTNAIQDSTSAIRNTRWFQQFQNEKDPLAAAKKAMADDFDATPIPNSNLIRVQMTYSVPEDCKTIVEEMVDKHIAQMRESQSQIESKKVDLLQRESKLVEIELNEDVLKQLREKENLLGLDQVGTSLSWNGKQFQLDRLLQEQARINSELAGFRSRAQMLTRDLEEGRTPAEVETQINNSGRFLQARQRLDDIEIELDQLEQKLGSHNDLVVSLKQRKVLYQQKTDEIHEELKSTYSETLRSMLENEIAAASANAGRVDEAVNKISFDLGKLNKEMNEYRNLQDRQKELQHKQNFLREEITKIRQFTLAADWATAGWASKPQKPDRPSFPVLWKSMGVAVFIGLSLSLGIAFLREMTDQTVRSPRDIARVGQLNLLGIVPHESDDPQVAGGRLPLAIFDAPNSMIAEQFRQVRTKLHHAASLDMIRSILVTSPSPGDGKTTVACNLAAALALNGRRILLVDANFRRPQLHTVFGANNDSGFAEVLNSLDLLDTLARPTDVPNLSVLSAGGRPSNASELFESQLFIDFLERAQEEYDHVIFDGAPLLVFSEAVAMAPRVDGVVTVVRARGNSRGLLMRMRDELRKVKAEHLGVVLNAVRSLGGGYYGRNIKTYYAYQNA